MKVRVPSPACSRRSMSSPRFGGRRGQCSPQSAIVGIGGRQQRLGAGMRACEAADYHREEKE